MQLKDEINTEIMLNIAINIKKKYYETKSQFLDLLRQIVDPNLSQRKLGRLGFSLGN